MARLIEWTGFMANVVLNRHRDATILGHSPNLLLLCADAMHSLMTMYVLKSLHFLGGSGSMFSGEDLGQS